MKRWWPWFYYAVWIDVEILWIRIQTWHLKRSADRLVGRMARDLGIRKADLWEKIQKS